MKTPIAIVGAACRLPGVPDVPAFWDLLISGRDAVAEIPPERFDIDRWYDPAPGKPGRIVSRVGGFLPAVDEFDATFFGVSPQAAIRTDPQQRLLLETTWNALEDAGIPAELLTGSRTGVYVSCWSSSYWDMLRAAGIYDLHAALSAEPGGTAAGFLAHHLDLRGPAMGLNATCATSLYAVHLACQALRSDEIDLAIVSAANLLLAPDSYLSFSEAEMLSPTGRWRFGDVRADGYIRSEGVVTLILKPLAAALADGDQVYASILGSAAVNDGRTGGTMLAPGLAGQAAMLRLAYRDAAVSPGDLDYVEAHGTGTPYGDPVELAALDAVLRHGRPPGRQCLVGSSKSNIGHTESAAGLVGLLKAALVLKHGLVPPTLHVDQPQAVLDEPDSPLRLATAAAPLPGHRPSLAGVSAFGLSGASAHVVVTGVAVKPAVEPRAAAGYVLPLSARTPAALAELAGKYANLLESGADPLDVSFSAGTRRTRHDRRLAVIGTDRQGLVDRLRAFETGVGTDGVRTGNGQVAAPPNVVFVFPGQGSQWAGMARELLARSPVFRATMAECDLAIEAELGRSAIQAIEAGHELSTVDEVQPVLWAVQVSIAALWRSWGIEPDLVIGHSMGEIGAATTSGALTIRDGASVICRRARLLAGLRAAGAMWAVQASEREASAAIAGHADQVCVGVVNSDHGVVLSGAGEALEEVVESLRGKGIYCRQVQVDYASHSPLMEPLRSSLLAALADIAPKAGNVPMWSTLLGEVIDGIQLDAGYWAENLRQPVRFADAVAATLARRSRTVFIEISPHPVLTSAIEDGIEARQADAGVIASLHRDQPELGAMLSGVAAAYVLGCEPSWEQLLAGGTSVPLPSYPWQRQRFWVRPSAADPFRSDAPPVGQVPSAPVTRPADVPRYLVERATEVLGLPSGALDPNLPLHVSGLDSLLAARLRNRISQELDLRLPVRDLLGARSLAELAEDLSAQLDS